MFDEYKFVFGIKAPFLPCIMGLNQEMMVSDNDDCEVCATLRIDENTVLLWTKETVESVAYLNSDEVESCTHAVRAAYEMVFDNLITTDLFDAFCIRLIKSLINK